MRLPCTAGTKALWETDRQNSSMKKEDIFCNRSLEEEGRLWVKRMRKRETWRPRRERYSIWLTQRSLRSQMTLWDYKIKQHCSRAWWEGLLSSGKGAILPQAPSLSTLSTQRGHYRSLLYPAEHWRFCYYCCCCVVFTWFFFVYSSSVVLGMASGFSHAGQSLYHWATSPAQGMVLMEDARNWELCGEEQPVGVQDDLTAKHCKTLGTEGGFNRWEKSYTNRN